MLLRRVPGFLDLLGTLRGATGELLRLVLDLLMQALEDRKHIPLESLFGLEVRVDDCLCVVAQVLEETGNTT